MGLNNLAKKWDDISDEVAKGPKIENKAYILKIVHVENFEKKEYLKIDFDFVDGELKDYFYEKSKDKLPALDFNGTIYRSYKETALTFFKQFITAVEKSNDGYSFVATNGDPQRLVGKRFVGVFGPTEIPLLDENNDNKPVVMNKLRFERSIEALRNNKITIPTDVKPLSSDYDLERYQELLAEVNGTTKQEPINYTSDEDLPF